MTITITKKQNRCLLLCTRANGTTTRADLGPGLPFHDMAHYVTEKKLGIKNGFFGMIEQGYTIEQLSDKEVIKTLGPESMLAEIFARALGSLYMGACSVEQFILLVFTEMDGRGQAVIIPPCDENTILEMYEEYKSLLEKWRKTVEGEMIVLSF